MSALATAAAVPSTPMERGAERLPGDRELLNLVREPVRALLLSTPAFRALSADEQRGVASGMVRVAACAAGCARELWQQSEQLGQRPVLLYREAAVPEDSEPVARTQAAADEFRPVAAGQIARVTEQTLRAVAFPRFVEDLIRGTFNAIVSSSIQEMEAYGQLLANASKTADEFEESVITDNQARDWLAQRWPQHIRIQVEDGQPRAVPAAGAEDREPPGDMRSELGLDSAPQVDEGTIEDVLVPAARRKLAASRLQTISTLVLMGINRIVVTGGKIRATMGFHIDATDRAHVETAEDFDIRHGAQGQFGMGMWSASASLSIAYVRSTRADSDAELNVETDLTGEVELHFRSDYFPISRFADASGIGRIQGNTAVPEANTPVEAIPWGQSSTVESRQRVQRAPRQSQIQRPAGGGLPPPPGMAVPVPALPQKEKQPAKEQPKNEQPKEKQEKQPAPKQEQQKQPQQEQKAQPQADQGADEAGGTKTGGRGGDGE
jgi:hypothetical protein